MANRRQGRVVVITGQQRDSYHLTAQVIMIDGGMVLV